MEPAGLAEKDTRLRYDTIVPQLNYRNGRQRARVGTPHIPAFPSNNSGFNFLGRNVKSPSVRDLFRSAVYANVAYVTRMRPGFHFWPSRCDDCA